MAHTIQVTTTTLKEKAQTLKNYNASFKKQVEALISTENALNGMWQGETHDEFHKAFQSDTTQMNNFYNAIEKYVQNLLEIVNKYDQAENKTKGIAQTRKYK